MSSNTTKTLRLNDVVIPIKADTQPIVSGSQEKIESVVVAGDIPLATFNREETPDMIEFTVYIDEVGITLRSLREAGFLDSKNNVISQKNHKVEYDGRTFSNMCYNDGFQKQFNSDATIKLTEARIQ
jgi:hypothetical protein